MTDERLDALLHESAEIDRQIEARSDELFPSADCPSFQRFMKVAETGDYSSLINTEHFKTCKYCQRTHAFFLRHHEAGFDQIPEEEFLSKSE